jgi:hypothetical protein
MTYLSTTYLPANKISRPHQNPHVTHGVPTYIKYVRAIKPPREVTQNVFQALIDLAENYPGFLINCVFDHIPLAKSAVTACSSI